MNTLDQIQNHLEFLGYKVEKTPAKEGSKAILAAKHTTHPNLFIIEIEPNFINFGSAFNINRPASPQMDVAINTINGSMDITRANYVVENGKVELRFDAPYQADYSKEVFGKFFTYLTTDIGKMYRIQSVFDAFKDETK